MFAKVKKSSQELMKALCSKRLHDANNLQIAINKSVSINVDTSIFILPKKTVW